ncbi:MAG TPA: hypothetical protein VF173_05520 [Thermoanaerobaculia bacterium]|nr:hypothetical protein [Thermoanaerobaculia bacterium]
MALATAFLREKRINIIITEACVTYRDRAHWDAVCDVSQAEGFSSLRETDHHNYEMRMRTFLKGLTKDFRTYIELPQNQWAFLQGQQKHAEFNPLPGLNDSYFNCDFARKTTLRFTGGGITLPDSLVDYILSPIRIHSRSLPSYAIITGNTEQRYLRLFFIEDYSDTFRAIVVNERSGFEGGGVGVLNQFLEALPEEVNIMKLSNYMVEKTEDSEKGRLEIIGHWNIPSAPVDPRAKLDYMKNEIVRIVGGIQAEDIDSKVHRQIFKVESFSTPDLMYPRVFISYSTRFEAEKLERLKNALWNNNFHPVLGTNYAAAPAEAEIPNPMTVPKDVMQTAFEAMRGCVALISLQVKREDFCVHDHNGGKRYVLPPWTVAEEVFAWARDIGMLIRLSDERVEDPRYNKNVHTIKFDSDEDYEAGVEEVIEALNNFRATPRFSAKFREACQQLFIPAYPSDQ